LRFLGRPRQSADSRRRRSRTARWGMSYQRNHAPASSAIDPPCERSCKLGVPFQEIYMLSQLLFLPSTGRHWRLPIHS
jgi:hypothetical protein